MGSTYLAHDTPVHDRVTTSRAVVVGGGHAVIEAGAKPGHGMRGPPATRHRRGAASMVGMQAAVTRDVPPYTVKGVAGRLNTFRLERLGVPPEAHPQLDAVLVHGSRDLDGLFALVRAPIEAWIERIRSWAGQVSPAGAADAGRGLPTGAAPSPGRHTRGVRPGPRARAGPGGRGR